MLPVPGVLDDSRVPSGLPDGVAAGRSTRMPAVLVRVRATEFTAVPDQGVPHVNGATPYIMNSWDYAALLA